MVCMGHGDVNQPESDSNFGYKKNQSWDFFSCANGEMQQTLGLHWLEFLVFQVRRFATTASEWA